MAGSFLAEIQPQADGANGLKYNLTPDIIDSIFKVGRLGLGFCVICAIIRKQASPRLRRCDEHLLNGTLTNTEH